MLNVKKINNIGVIFKNLIMKNKSNLFYNNLVILSRNSLFYNKINLPDTFETRIYLIFIHFSILLISHKIKFKKKFSQNIYDDVFKNIENNIRELGYGDVAVNKKMKIFNKIFYDILIKIETAKNDESFNINKKTLEKYFHNKNNDDKIDLLLEYFNNYRNFCFELNETNMLKGYIKIEK